MCADNIEERRLVSLALYCCCPLPRTRSTLERVRRGIEFCSKVASAQNFLLNLTGCRVLHFTWNGDGNEEQV